MTLGVLYTAPNAGKVKDNPVEINIGTSLCMTGEG
ncbi:predicted protein [Botrytis cinerea T4]|uniref:Uncharacterized protein n=1 Tax=Botryotinia fuckeliana (strain T4) TaxID=999810 RepID=G2Y6K5_BOTF4|nr:predicted protein [Botrytis cinerea T4]